MKTQKWFIAVKTGLLAPKHVKAMGDSVWLFLHLCNEAQWDTGRVVWNVTDAAAVLGLSRPTIRKYHARLQTAAYVSTTEVSGTYHSQILNWRNPKQKAIPAYGWPTTEKQAGNAPETSPERMVESRVETLPQASSSIPDSQIKQINTPPQSHPADAGGGAVFLYLKKLGINEPKLTQLSGNERLSVECLKDIRKAIPRLLHHAH